MRRLARNPASATNTVILGGKRMPGTEDGPGPVLRARHRRSVTAGTADLRKRGSPTRSRAVAPPAPPLWKNVKEVVTTGPRPVPALPVERRDKRLNLSEPCIAGSPFLIRVRLGTGPRRVRQLAQVPYLTDREISHGRSPLQTSVCQAASTSPSGRTPCPGRGKGHSLRLNCSTLLIGVKGTQKFSESANSCSPALDTSSSRRRQQQSGNGHEMNGQRGSRCGRALASQERS
jgi:hypothetical protein